MSRVPILGVGDKINAAQIPDLSGTYRRARLARTSYDPTSAAAYSTTSTVAVDVDATNLAVTFAAPASGKVAVRLEALATVPAGFAIWWYLREGTTNVDSRYLMTQASSLDQTAVATLEVSGLTPGSSHTYKWGYSVDGGTGKLFAGGTIGPAIMEVDAL